MVGTGSRARENELFLTVNQDWIISGGHDREKVG